MSTVRVNSLVDPKLNNSIATSVAVQMIPAGILGIATLFMIETPQFLIKRGRREEAFKNLVWLRMLPADHICR